MKRESNRMKNEDYQHYIKTGQLPAKDTPALVAVSSKPPNKTEQAASRIFAGNWTFEGRAFDICGGAKYTPDWVDMETATAIEAKGEHIHSRDSRRRFDEAKHLFPQWTWIWARLRTTGRKGRRWDVEIYEKVV